MKLIDPTLPYADVVARHRRENAGKAVAFGLWATTHDWRQVYPDPAFVAGIGGSLEALSSPAVDLTQQLIGASGGLLVDLAAER